MHIRRAVSTLFVTLSALTLCGGVGAQDANDPPREVVFLNYNVAPDIGDAPLWMVPHALGYFADEGLDVSIQQSGGSSASLQFLAAGKGDFASSTPAQLILATQQGLDIKAVLKHNRTFGSALVVPTTAGIKTVDELRSYLKGNAIGVSSLSSGRVPYARAWIQELGLEEGTDVSLVAVGVGPQAAAALKTDRVRALVIYDAVYAAIEAATDVRFTRFEADWQKPLFSGVVAATDDMIEKDPDLVARFGRAVAKALVFSTTNPEAVVRIFWTLHPENRPAADAEAVELKKSVKIVESMVPNWLGGLDKPGARWGDQSAAEWEQLQDYYMKTGLLEKKLPVDTYFTDRFTAQINDFDAEAIKKQAREFDESMIRFPDAQ